MSGVKGDPCGNRKARAPRPAYRGAKTAPRAVFRAREIPARAETDVAGVVGVGCCLRLAEGLTEACGPGMPGPYREVKKVGCQVGARCGGGVKTPPYEWKIQWQQTQSVRAGHARPLRAA